MGSAPLAKVHSVCKRSELFLLSCALITFDARHDCLTINNDEELVALVLCARGASK